MTLLIIQSLRSLNRGPISTPEALQNYNGILINEKKKDSFFFFLLLLLPKTKVRIREKVAIISLKFCLSCEL